LGKFGPLMHQQIAIIVLLWIALQVPLGSAIGDWIRLGMVAKLKITSDPELRRKSWKRQRSALLPNAISYNSARDSWHATRITGEGLIPWLYEQLGAS